MKQRLELFRLGEVPYQSALDLQHHLRKLCHEDESLDGFVVCLQHPPVVTLGKRGKDEDLISPESLASFGAEIFHVDRGGEATYHGPGQLVVYPIVRIKNLGIGVVDLVRGLAETLSETVRDISGVELRYDTEHPGLWTVETPARKMASVGMRVAGGVSTHGAAINLNTNLIPFSYIVACGMPNAPMTRLQDYGPDPTEPIDIDAFVDNFLPRFSELLDRPIVLSKREISTFIDV